MSEQLRIRPDNGTIRELNIPKEIAEELQKIVSSPRTTDDIKKIMIKKLTGVSPCCCCGNIPSMEVVYDCDGASRDIVQAVLIEYSLEMLFCNRNAVL